MPKAHLLSCLLSLLCVLPPAGGQDKKKDADKPPAPPKVLHTVPLVVEPGKKTRLTVYGDRLDAVTAVKASDPAATVKLAGKPEGFKPPQNYPAERLGSSKLHVELELPKGAKPGTVSLIAVGPGGESAAYPLLIPDDAVQRAKEKEPNDGFAKANELTLPAAAEGVIERDRDVDVFRFAGKAGQTVRTDVIAARFGSPLDATLTLHDADRRLIATADDAPGSADPTLTVTLPRDGVYFLTVSDANDFGGGQYGYRLVVR